MGGSPPAGRLQASVWVWGCNTAARTGEGGPWEPFWGGKQQGWGRGYYPEGPRAPRMGVLLFHLIFTHYQPAFTELGSLEVAWWRAPFCPGKAAGSPRLGPRAKQAGQCPGPERWSE